MKKLFLAVALLATSFANAYQTFLAGPSGGYGGYVFQDSPPSDFDQVILVKACSNKYLDSVEMVVRDRSGDHIQYGKHGGNAIGCKTLYFWEGEYITSVSGRYGRYVDSIRVKTSEGRELFVGGTTGAATYKFEGDDQYQIAGFHGLYNLLVDAIGVVYVKKY